MNMNKYTIDRSKWRCGKNSEYKHGKGNTRLLNEEGYMCCLGHIALQCGLTRDDILNISIPSYTNKIIEPLTIPSGPFVCEDSNFTNSAISVNDSELLNNKEREQELIKLGQEYRLEIGFTGEY